MATVVMVGARPGQVERSWEALHHLHALWSRFLPDSDFGRLNRAGGSWVEVDPRTVALIKMMIWMSAETAGAYDPTLLPALIELGYAASRTNPAAVTHLPDDARIGGDLTAIEFDGTAVRLPAEMTLDTGGIAKGHAADLLVQDALEAGAAGVMVSIAGDLVVAGDSPDGALWRIGIEDPADPLRQLAVVGLTHGAVATSSRLKRRWLRGAEEVHHLIDPRTGRSSTSSVVAMSVRADLGARAEAFAKVGFMRDAREAIGLVDRAGAAALLVDETGATVRSQHWEELP